MQNQWIPVTQPPTESDEYLITWKTSLSSKSLLSIAEYVIHQNDETEWILDDYIHHYPNVEIIAWMPLPEPYKEN